MSFHDEEPQESGGRYHLLSSQPTRTQRQGEPQRNIQGEATAMTSMRAQTTGGDYGGEGGFGLLAQLGHTSVYASSTSPDTGGDERKESHDTDLHERDVLPEFVQTPIGEVLIRSVISKLPPSEQGDAIVQAFNVGIGSDRAITTTNISCRSGQRLDRGEIMLAHRNFIPEIHGYTHKKLTTCLTFFRPMVVIEEIGVFKRTDPFYGAHGVYVCNVPVGKYGLVWFGPTAKLLEQGTHVIHDVTFRLALATPSSPPTSAFIDISTPQIQHGTIHIFRVPVGHIAKVWMNTTTPHLLYSRGDGVPYIINDSQFRVEEMVSQSDTYIAHGTIHILRVGAGKIAKIWIGVEAILLTSRLEPYKFHSPIFRFNPADVCSQLDPYISHGTKHILRIPSGSLCRVWIGSEPRILESRLEPYTFDDPLFRVANPAQPFSSQMEPYFRHANFHRLRIPAGKIAKVWLGNTPTILSSKEDPYEFNSPFFLLSPNDPAAINGKGDISKDVNLLFHDAFAPYIQHGTISIVRVPSGKIARAWEGAKAILLEHREAPYEYNTPLFRLDPRRSRAQESAQQYISEDAISESKVDRNDDQVIDKDQVFEDSTSSCIIHGSLKRLQPRTGEVCLCYDNGQLVIRGPSSDGKPIMIDDENCRVDGFMSVGIQTLVFPSEATKILRRRENAAISIEETNYEIFTTRDSLRVGVKLLVAYRVVDAYKAVTALTKIGVMKFVENASVVDMGRCIQACSSKDFLSSATNRPSAALSNQQGNPGEPSLLQHFQDTVKIALAADLAEYGIELVRLNFETPKVLDKDIAKQMAEQALNVASVSSQEAVMKQKAEIARVQAEQQATVRTIEQEQLNANKLSIARTLKESAQLEADAVVIAAEGARKAAAMQGAQFGEHPSLLQIRLAEIQAQTMMKANISMMIAPNEVSHAMAAISNMNSLMKIAGGKQ